MTLGTFETIGRRLPSNQVEAISNVSALPSIAPSSSVVAMDVVLAGFARPGTPARAVTIKEGTAAAIEAVADAVGGDGKDVVSGFGKGGAGGTVTQSRAVALNGSASGDATATATGFAGNGGDGIGKGNSGGADGIARNVTAEAHAAGTGTSLAIAAQVGGVGGNGFKGAAGGDGGDSYLVNATRSSSDGGRAIHDHEAIAGAGGNSAGGRAGDGGDAVSRLTLDDLKARHVSAHVDAYLLAQGGAGGSATERGVAGTGGSSDAYLSLRAQELTFLVQSGGGAGGNGATKGGVGGNARVVVDAVGGTGNLFGNAESEAGRGGDATVAGDGAAGGRALSSSATARGGGFITSARLDTHAGDGGGGRGSGYSGADGQSAGPVSVQVVNTAGNSAYGAATARAGNGGDGTEGADAGRGGNAIMKDTVAARSEGGVISLGQAAFGGSGGISIGGDGGAGGIARAVTQLNTAGMAPKASFVDVLNRATGGDGGAAVGAGSFGGIGGDATATASVRAGMQGATATAAAAGGAGGDALDGAFAQIGGDALAVATSRSQAGAVATVNVSAGKGGTSYDSGHAAAGGVASGTATGIGGTNVIAELYATSGDGGAAIGTKAAGGDGTTIGDLSAHAEGKDFARATVFGNAGNGGMGTNGAAGGHGANALLVNAVSGIADGGQLILAQYASAGRGGDSQDGKSGHGGDASSTLTYDEARQSKHAGTVELSVNASGGRGGDQLGKGGIGGDGGDGGDGTASGSFAGSKAVGLSATVTAFGGAGGSGGRDGASGDADATGRATGGDVHLAAAANVFDTGGHSGLAQSIGSARGTSGETEASASVIGAGDALARATGSISMSLTGGADALVAAGARAGGDMPGVNITANSTISIQTDLDAADLRGIYAGNSAMKKAFSGDVEALTSGQFQGVHGTGSGLQTIVSSMQVFIKPAQLDAMGDTVIALTGGKAVGSGFETMHVQIEVGDVDRSVLFSIDLDDEKAAERFFTDHTFNFGNLGEFVDDFGNLFVTVDVTTITKDAGSGFKGSLVIADVGGDAAHNQMASSFTSQLPIDDHAFSSDYNAAHHHSGDYFFV